MALRMFTVISFLILAGYATCQGQPESINKAKSLFEARNFTEATKILGSINSSSSLYADAQYFLGRIAVEQKRYDESITRFQAAIEADKGKAEYHNWLGVMYGVVAMDASSIKQAYYAPKIKNEFEEAATLEPLNLQTQWGLINYYTKAPGFLGGSWSKAFDCARVISSQDQAQGYRALGFIHAAQKKNDQAEKELMQAVSANQGDPENYFALAIFYMDQKQFAKSLGVYEQLLGKDPGNMVAAFHLGHAAAQCGQQLDRGIVCLNKYLGYTPHPNEPSHSGASADLAMIYEKKGDKSKAKAAYQTALRLEPGMKEAKDGLERLN